jgi:hypothetical protein
MNPYQSPQEQTGSFTFHWKLSKDILTNTLLLTLAAHGFLIPMGLWAWLIINLVTDPILLPAGCAIVLISFFWIGTCCSYLK